MYSFGKVRFESQYMKQIVSKFLDHNKWQEIEHEIFHDNNKEIIMSHIINDNDKNI